MQRIIAPTAGRARRQLSKGGAAERCCAGAGAPDANADHVDEGAPFAVGVSEGGALDTRGLETLMRLLERPEPVFLADEDDAADASTAGGEGRIALSLHAAGAGDADFDSLLSMPAASDLSVVSESSAPFFCAPLRTVRCVLTRS
jgi:hypothetical protein